MDLLGVVVAAGIALVAMGALVQLVWGSVQIPTLPDVPPIRAGAPRVSIVVAARDEERHVEAAVHALLDQRYPDYELIVVDDRSVDGTSAVLDRLRTRDARLSVVRVDVLPPGWLGKNHALELGARAATGELILFTDADVMLTPDALSRAVRLLHLERADHLAVAPELVVPTWPLALVVNYFTMWFLLWLRPWAVRREGGRSFVGIGAFNLVRASSYRAIGGHGRIAMRPDDDLMLGKLLRRSGFEQRIATGGREVRVEWYRTLGEMARGLRKNAFAGLNYSVPLVGLAVVGNLALAVWPFAAVWFTDGWERLLYGVAALAQVIAYGAPALAQRTRPWLAVLYPVAALAFLWILCAAVLRTLRTGGIDWRGTTYSLDQLRANEV